MEHWTCGICGKHTHEVDYDYLSGTDHLECVLEKENNREKYREQQRRQRKKVKVRIKDSLRNRLNSTIRLKRRTSLEYMGCDLSVLMGYLEVQFKEGMTWDNYGKWHIDHIKPCCLFDLEDEAEQLICFHYSNLQPLWAEENWKKGNKYDG